MAARNYNSSEVGVPYIRVPELGIKHPEPGTAQVRFAEDLAVKMADGSIASIAAAGEVAFQVSPADMLTEVPLVDPTTGQPLPGNPRVTYQHVMLCILAVVRARQVERDLS
jgi:hypothetical protein